MPDTNISQFLSASSLDFRESQIPARGLNCGAYTAPVTAPLPKCFLTWECNLGTEVQLQHQGIRNSLLHGRQVELAIKDSRYSIMLPTNRPIQPLP